MLEKYLWEVAVAGVAGQGEQPVMDWEVVAADGEWVIGTVLGS